LEVKRIRDEKGNKVTVNIHLEGQNVKALVGTGAQVSIISEQVYHNFKLRPSYLAMVKLRMANGSVVENGIRVGPVRMKIGRQWYIFPVLVAPLSEGKQMILGYDILKSQS
jgi:predicted aspartyl protease